MYFYIKVYTNLKKFITLIDIRCDVIKSHETKYYFIFFLQKIHQNITEYMQRQQYRFNWLPKEQLEWYCKTVLCLEKEQKPQHFLPYLYDNLQRLAITFHELKKFHLNSNVETTEIIHNRNRMIEVISNQVLQVKLWHIICSNKIYVTFAIN